MQGPQDVLAVQESLCYVSILLPTCYMAIVKKRRIFTFCKAFLVFILCIYIYTYSVDRELECKSQDLETVVEGCRFGD